MPEDVTVVGFDDLPDSMVVDPILTVASQPAYEMGSQAKELLLKRLSDELTETYHELILPTEMIMRRSSAPPKN